MKRLEGLYIVDQVCEGFSFGVGVRQGCVAYGQEVCDQGHQWGVSEVTFMRCTFHEVHRA